MRVPSKLSLATLALVGACSAGTMAKPDNGTGAAPMDTVSTTARDTSGLDTSTTTARDTTAQNDTTMVPPGAAAQPAPSDSSGRTVPGMAQPDSTSGQQSIDSTSGMDTTRTDSSSTGR